MRDLLENEQLGPREHYELSSGKQMRNVYFTCAVRKRERERERE